MPQVMAALGRLETRHSRADGAPAHVAGVTARRAQDRCPRRNDVRDRMPIGTVFRETPEPRPHVFDRAADRRPRVTRPVVHDDEVAGGERWRQDRLERGEAACAGDRASKHRRRGEARHAERREKRGGGPAAIGRVGGHAGAVEPAALAPHAIGPPAAFIEKDETRGIAGGGRGGPREPGACAVRAVVFGRAYRFC
jgi:hypothetical protein